jgi:hypothetical protein
MKAYAVVFEAALEQLRGFRAGHPGLCFDRQNAGGDRAATFAKRLRFRSKGCG